MSESGSKTHWGAGFISFVVGGTLFFEKDIGGKYRESFGTTHTQQHQRVLVDHPAGQRPEEKKILVS